MMKFLLTLCILFTTSGCLNVELQAHGSPEAAPVISKTLVGSYYKYWITDSPQEILDHAAQKETGGKVSTQGIFKVKTEVNLFYNVVATAFLGFIAPMDIYCWLQTDQTTHTLPEDIHHKRTRN